jgi:hypothetical protein
MDGTLLDDEKRVSALKRAERKLKAELTAKGPTRV